MEFTIEEKEIFEYLGIEEENWQKKETKKLLSAAKKIEKKIEGFKDVHYCLTGDTFLYKDENNSYPVIYQDDDLTVFVEIPRKDNFSNLENGYKDEIRFYLESYLNGENSYISAAAIEKMNKADEEKMINDIATLMLSDEVLIEDISNNIQWYVKDSPEYQKVLKESGDE